MTEAEIVFNTNREYTLGWIMELLARHIDVREVISYKPLRSSSRQVIQVFDIYDEKIVVLYFDETIKRITAGYSTCQTIRVETN